MLTYAMFNEINKIVSQSSVAFSIDLKEQVGQVCELIQKSDSQVKYMGLTPAHVAAYVCTMQTDGDKSEEEKALIRQELGLAPVVTRWSKANPPKEIFGLIQTHREPCWYTDFQTALSAVELLEYDSVTNQCVVASAILVKLGLGGYQDIHYKNSLLTADDATLQTMVDGTIKGIEACRPDWCIDGEFNADFDRFNIKPDTRCKAVITAEAEELRLLQKAADKKKIVAEKKAKDAAELRAKRQAKLKEFKNHELAGPEFATEVNMLLNNGFEHFKSYAGDNYFKLLANTYTKHNPLNTDYFLELGTAIFDEVFQVHPTWFRVMKDGTLRPRKIEDKPTSEISLHDKLITLLKRYGFEQIFEELGNIGDEVTVNDEE